LPIAVQEAGKAFNRFFDLALVRQGNHAEVVGAYPVEARALHDEHFFLREKIAGKLHVVADVEFLNVQLGENVERAFGAHAAYAVDVVEHFGGDDALVVEPPAGNDKLVDALVAGIKRVSVMF